jgi:agmatine deiminase
MRHDGLMAWIMPAETAPHARTWLVFPAAGPTLGETAAERDECYATWAAVARAVAEFEPVTLVTDPAEMVRARRLLGDSVTYLELPVDEFWARDHGPTFVVDGARPGVLGAVTWAFNGWGNAAWADWAKAARHGELIARAAGAEIVPSALVQEGGGFHTDGDGTVLATVTVQLDPARNPGLTRPDVEAELARTIGAGRVVWLERGLTRDYDALGTRGHVDIVAALPSPGVLLLHDQPDPGHPDHAVTRALRAHLERATDARGRAFEIVDLPAPGQRRDAHGFTDYSYVNHYAVNGGVIACGFGDATADARARDILAAAYPGRRVVTVDARPIFARGGGIHCITQQQPAVGP